MKNITLSEWKDRIRALESVMVTRHPAVEVSLDQFDSVGLRTEHCSGSVDLVLGPKGEGMVARVYVGSGKAMSGSMSDVEHGLYEYRLVVDALHYCEAQLGELRIWGDGDCPCDPCKGTGKGCTFCGGTGQR